MHDLWLGTIRITASLHMRTQKNSGLILFVVFHAPSCLPKVRDSLTVSFCKVLLTESGKLNSYVASCNAEYLCLRRDLQNHLARKRGLVASNSGPRPFAQAPAIFQTHQIWERRPLSEVYNLKSLKLI